MMYVVEDRLLFCGDLLFAGRVPFVGNADSKGWLNAMDRMMALDPAVVVPGHGSVSRDVRRDLITTRDYLVYLRATMGRAVQDLEPFDEAYAKADWSRFKGDARVRAGQPHQRLRYVPADGAGRTERNQAVSTR